MFTAWFPERPANPAAPVGAAISCVERYRQAFDLILPSAPPTCPRSNKGSRLGAARSLPVLRLATVYGMLGRA